MKLLLTSTGLDAAAVRSAFLSVFRTDPAVAKVLFVVSAVADPDKTWYTQKSRQELLDLGIREENIITYHRGPKPDAEALSHIDLISVGGGNTFHLWEELRRSGLDQDIRERVEGGAPYLGASAGSIIATPTIRTAAPWDDNDRGLTDLDAFAFVPFTIVPHYAPEEEGTVAILEKGLNMEVKRITDSQAILVDGDQVRLIG